MNTMRQKLIETFEIAKQAFIDCAEWQARIA
jgi:hypothetical protein